MVVRGYRELKLYRRDTLLPLGSLCASEGWRFTDECYWGLRLYRRDTKLQNGSWSATEGWGFYRRETVSQRSLCANEGGSFTYEMQSCPSLPRAADLHTGYNAVKRGLPKTEASQARNKVNKWCYVSWEDVWHFSLKKRYEATEWVVTRYRGL